MTAPIRPETQNPSDGPSLGGTPLLHRILSPDEFAQAQQLGPDILAKNPFPLLPPAAPKDAVKRLDPNSGAPDRSVPEQMGAAARNSSVGKSPGLTGILTRQVAAPILEHPFLTAAGAVATAAVPALGTVWTGVMGKDLLEYSAQKAAELSLDPQTRKLAEADPERISGEQAGVEAGMMGLAPMLHALPKVGEALGAATRDVRSSVADAIAPEAAAERRGLERAANTDPLTGLGNTRPWADVKTAAEANPDARVLRFDVNGFKGVNDAVGHAAGDQALGEIAQAIRTHADGLPAFRVGGDEFAVVAPAGDAARVRDAIESEVGVKTATGADGQSARYSISGGIGNTDAEADADAIARKAEHKAAQGIDGRVENAPAGGSSQDLALATAGGNERFSGVGIPEPMRSAIKTHVDAVSDSWKQIFAPATRSPEAAEAAGILRAATGEAAGAYEQAAFKLDEFRRAIDPLPETDKLGFIDAIEGGRSQVNPEFQGPADLIRKTLDTARDQIRALGTGKLEHFIEDYFPHIWTDPDAAANVFKPGDALAGAQPGAGGKRPMEGSRAFLKQRSIPTTFDGIQAGLTPVSTNPVDLTLLKLREMQRYLVAHQSLNEMKDAGLVTFVRAGEQAPDGYARINDKIATVFGPREGAVTLPAGANIDPGDVTVAGTRIMGEHWAPEPVARVVNNYLSPGLRGNAIYDAYRGIGNTLNQAQLGLSAFHLGFTSLDASVSRVALGLEHLASGDVASAASEIASAPAAPISNAILGAKIRRAYLNPDGADPQMLALANAVKEAGGRVRMDSFYKNSAAEKMVANWREGGAIGTGKAAAYALPALIEASMKPIMEHIVPMQKLGVFGDMATKALAELPDDATLAERRAALQGAWDSVDNRLGQLVYDNLFWNKTVKDLSMASVRSVGWNLGTIREVGGGLADIAAAPGKLNAGEGLSSAVTHRAAYVAALPITIGLYGAVYQYLRTGEMPADAKDLYFPRTGEVDADGNPERVQLPSYMKDVVAYSGAPWETIKHKEGPLLSAIGEMLNNEDFYGDEIRNPNDPMVTQLKQEAEYVAKTAIPFSFRGMGEQAKRGDQSDVTKFGNWVGVTPAPRAKVRSAAQNMMADDLKGKSPSDLTPEEAEHQTARADLLRGLRGVGDIDTQKVDEALSSGSLTSPDIAKLLKRAGMTPAQEKFKRLTLAQAVKVFEAGTDREKALFADALMKKVARASSTAEATSGTP